MKVLLHTSRIYACVIALLVSALLVHLTMVLMSDNKSEKNERKLKLNEHHHVQKINKVGNNNSDPIIKAKL